MVFFAEVDRPKPPMPSGENIEARLSGTGAAASIPTVSAEPNNIMAIGEYL